MKRILTRLFFIASLTIIVINSKTIFFFFVNTTKNNFYNFIYSLVLIFALFILQRKVDGVFPFEDILQEKMKKANRKVFIALLNTILIFSIVYFGF
ncbi:hypothetical protein A2Z22_04600 [Candidatus Woesebacteria bacterium RBG_16_34_12]|uniref:Uncharacterized protein n=1 Tax=Candidatus Woesebacteria bacterium RBG_16_34_12 TaxID=1802480 RepID=A0A1F7XDM4_9BACT|nr:MAG: hypothetical protein A2Z22_04600 [Candidatus Woesebacteria bacterium RBG_16_34_12]